MDSTLLPKFDVTSETILIKSNPGGNWKVKRGKVQRGPVTWTCDVDCFLWIMFPKQWTPLKDGVTQLFGFKSVRGDLSGAAAGRYTYCILAQDADGEFQLVESNSPPDMDIQ